MTLEEKRQWDFERTILLLQEQGKGLSAIAAILDVLVAYVHQAVLDWLWRSA